tara:strand:+ start:110 stop:517 length:408 start_codon:yes stop_codon:yes gene_type:complete
MSTAATTLAVSESVTTVTVEEDVTTINIAPEITTVEAAGIAISTANAGALAVTPHGTITATNVQDALNQLADQNFRGTTAPTAGTANLEEGDFFYDTDDDQLKVYRETSTGTFEFVPIMVGNISPDSDTVDAGAF